MINRFYIRLPDPKTDKVVTTLNLSVLRGLMLLLLMSERKDRKAAFRLGPILSPHQLTVFGFRHGYASACHATLTKLLQILDTSAIALDSSQVVANPIDEIATDGS